MWIVVFLAFGVLFDLISRLVFLLVLVSRRIVDLLCRFVLVLVLVLSV